MEQRIVVFVDMAGSMALRATTPDADELIHTHNRVVLEAAQAALDAGGAAHASDPKFVGDGLMLSFAASDAATAADGARAAIEAITKDARFADVNAPKAGIALGDSFPAPYGTQTDHLGPAVAVAAELVEIAAPMQILLNDAFYRALVDDDTGGLAGSAEHGTVRLSCLPDEVIVWSLYYGPARSKPGIVNPAYLRPALVDALRVTEELRGLPARFKPHLDARPFSPDHYSDAKTIATWAATGAQGPFRCVAGLLKPYGHHDAAKAFEAIKNEFEAWQGRWLKNQTQLRSPNARGECLTELKLILGAAAENGYGSSSLDHFVHVLMHALSALDRRDVVTVAT